MIYTITLNPSLDVTLEVEELLYDDINRVVVERKRASGKGIDISRTIKELGGESTALGLIGGFRGLEIESMLINEGIACDFTRIGSESKSHIILHQRKKRTKTFLSTPDPAISSLDLSLFFKKIREIPEGSFVIISGSSLETVDALIYQQLISILNENSIKTVFDGDGEILKKGLAGRPYMIKPNVHEFNRIIGKKIIKEEEIIENARPILEMVDMIIITLGVKGAILIQNNYALMAIPPKVRVKNSIGAGDAFIAGMIYGLSRGDNIEESLTLGVACGTASTLNESTGSVKKQDVFEIKKDVILKKI